MPFISNWHKKAVRTSNNHKSTTHRPFRIEKSNQIETIKFYIIKIRNSGKIN